MEVIEHRCNQILMDNTTKIIERKIDNSNYWFMYSKIKSSGSISMMEVAQIHFCPFCGRMLDNNE